MSNRELREQVTQTGVEQNQMLLDGSWWHSIDLGGGLVTPGVHSLSELQNLYHSLELPEDLSGKTLLDIGCWDGFYTFETERHGAQVTAVDCWRPGNFFAAHEALNSTAGFHELSVYNIAKEKTGAYDIVLFLGVLYHLRHPLLALERVCEVTRDFAIIESHIIDKMRAGDEPAMEFYEFDELGGMYDNWWAPNVECLAQMTRSAENPLAVRTRVARVNRPTKDVVFPGSTPYASNPSVKRWQRLSPFPQPTSRIRVPAPTYGSISE